MIKEFIYDCESAPRREPNQCYNDINALMIFTLLCNGQAFNKDKQSDILRNFINREVSLPLQSQFSEQMQNDLITINNNLLPVLNMRLSTELMAFIIGLMGNTRKFDKFVKFYASEKNTIYFCVERILQGIATEAADGCGSYTLEKDGKIANFFFIENDAIQQLREFKRLINWEKYT